MLSLASLESHVTFTAEPHDLRLGGGIVPKKNEVFYQKKNKGAGQVESHFYDTHRRGKVERTVEEERHLCQAASLLAAGGRVT